MVSCCNDSPELVWLNRFTGCQPSHQPQKLCNQKDILLRHKLSPVTIYAENTVYVMEITGDNICRKKKISRVYIVAIAAYIHLYSLLIFLMFSLSG